MKTKRNRRSTAKTRQLASLDSKELASVNGGYTASATSGTYRVRVDYSSVINQDSYDTGFGMGDDGLPKGAIKLPPPPQPGWH